MEGEEAAGAAEVWGSGAEWRGVKKEELASPSAVAKAILGTASDHLTKMLEEMYGARGKKIEEQVNRSAQQQCRLSEGVPIGRQDSALYLI